jgi:hypothetical protein
MAHESTTVALANESNAAYVFFESSRHCALRIRHTIDQDFHLVVLRRLRDAVRRKGPEMWTAGNWLLQQDNAHAHSAVETILGKTFNSSLTTSCFYLVFEYMLHLRS